MRADQLESALAALWTELQRVVAHGFGEAEVARAKADVRAQLQTLYLEREQAPSESLGEELKEHFLLGAPCLGAPAEVALSMRLLDEVITPAAVGAAARALYHDGGRDTVVLLTLTGWARPVPRRAARLVEARRRLNRDLLSDLHLHLHLSLAHMRRIVISDSYEWDSHDSSHLRVRPVSYEVYTRHWDFAWAFALVRAPPLSRRLIPLV